MKNLTKMMAALLLLTIFFSCQQNAPAPAAVSAVQVSSQQLKKEEGTEPEKAFKFEISYPKVTGGAESLTHNVQNWVENVITSLVMPETDTLAAALPLEKCLEKFMADWKENASGGGMLQAYTLEMTDTVLHNSPKCLSLRLDAYIFTAGAHGTPVTSIENFDPATGQKIMTSQVIKNQEAILTILDKKYRELKKEALTDGSSPYFDKKITFPANWAYLENGILFHYNAYEIAAYALGDADIFLTWGELGAHATKL